MSHRRPGSGYGRGTRNGYCVRRGAFQLVKTAMVICVVRGMAYDARIGSVVRVVGVGCRVLFKGMGVLQSSKPKPKPT